MDLAQMIVHFASTFSVAMWRLLWVLGALVGTVYVGTSLMRMVRASRLPGSQPVTLGDILPIILIGGVLLNLSGFINAVWTSFGSGSTSYGPISYDGAAAFGRFADAINAVLTLASVAGGGFFFKGVVLLKKACMEGQSSHGADDSVWRAMVHMVGGAGLVQIPQLIDAVRQSFGLFW
jgi:hypothetical protein